MKAMLIIMLIAFSVTAFCQETNTRQQLMKEEYHLKSKRQKSGAIPLLVIGTIFTPISYLARGFDEKGSRVGLTVGIGALAGSAVLFTAAIRNEKKSNSISTGLSIEKMPGIHGTGMAYKSYPAISLMYSL